MKHTAVERRTELLRLHTGLSWQSARRRVEPAAPGTPLIPEPGTQQMLLAARVMAALAWRQIHTLHPWGIESVAPLPDGLLLRGEGDNVAQRGPDETMAWDLADVLLPRADEFGEIRGCPDCGPTSREGRWCCACWTCRPRSPWSASAPGSGWRLRPSRMSGWAETTRRSGATVTRRLDGMWRSARTGGRAAMQRRARSG
jgi:hypothetical protein